MNSLAVSKPRSKAIITGATGFIGRFLVRELRAQNVKVIAVVRPGSKNLDVIERYHVQVVECDMENYLRLPNLIKDRDISALYHIAWQGISDIDAKNYVIQLDNVKATMALVEAANKMNIKTFIGAGSIHEEEAFVEMKMGRPITNLGYMYKIAKVAAHGMAKTKAESYGMRFFWPLINTYGEEEKSARLINTIIRKIFDGESPALSAGDQIYDFVHVSDVAHALYLIAEKGIDGANYMIGSGEAKPLKDFLITVGKITNRLNGNTNIPLGFGQVISNVVSLPHTVFNTANLVRDTGFVCQVSFEQGIERTARWIQKTRE